MAAPATTEFWRENWEHAFNPSTLSSLLKVEHAIHNRTFVRVEMQSKTMIKVWLDLLRHNNIRLITSSQQSIFVAGPCKLYMCYFTSNHMDVRDPMSISCIVPMYVQKSFICFQGLMELNKSLTGSVIQYEQLSLLIITSRFAPRDDSTPFEFIFISPTQGIGRLLRQLMDSKNIGFNQCIGSSLYSAFHTHSKEKCTCSLKLEDWKSSGLSCSTDNVMFTLPRMKFNDIDMGTINLAWATGRAFDITRQSWIVSDQNVASLTDPWLQKNKHKELRETETSSFLSVLSGIDGIHTIDFNKFTTLDPVELPQILAPSAPESVSKP
jgi:hypothetical protein